MTANAARRSCDRSAGSPAEGSFRRAVPMAGTGDVPRPDPTTFAPSARCDGERRGDRRAAADRRSTDGRRAGERRATTNRTAADDPTQ
ncbi:hypothetical protein DVK05_13370 [Halorubrum sp. Atlit-8R]|uniref:hypothetical protein n=1 Tax=unclassified Halorubrum TaxID=2642239 RepID=UPI000EF18C5A|nr:MULTISPECIES: hypothetical protein [unclassified Halorubrum]RLM63894.1 hypothetical protein DVK08_15115 [Halorubrum sp. Atlit-9R]RLM77273.1 hypothetical protein DVK05_13370 [Halorubrum sp. Atlit-8R]